MLVMDIKSSRGTSEGLDIPRGEDGTLGVGEVRRLEGRFQNGADNIGILRLGRMTSILVNK